MGGREHTSKGVERRIKAGLNPDVRSVASLFISRWDKAVADKVAENLRDRLGIAMAKLTYKAYRDLLNSNAWKQLEREGAKPQRLLWASTSTKDPKASDVLYVSALAAPDTINTLPESTLLAFADHGKVSGLLTPDGGNYESELKLFADAGVDVVELAESLQREGAELFDQSWKDLLARVDSKCKAVKKMAKASGSH